MVIERSQSGSKAVKVLSIGAWVCFFQFIGKAVHGLYGLLSARAYSIIMFGAMFCTLAVKLFHSLRIGLLNEYLIWILEDIAVLLAIEVVLAVLCFRWPRKFVIRTVLGFAAVVCAWSVMNAGWLIRTGTQILPTVLLPLIRAPLNSLGIIGVNLAKMPATAVILLAPSAVALTFFFFVFANPPSPNYSRKLFVKKVLITAVVVLAAVLARKFVARRGSPQIASAGLRYNCHSRAVTGFLLSDSRWRARADLAYAKREIPAFDRFKLELPPKARRINHNVVIVVLEGVQYSYTSLAGTQSGLHFAGLHEPDKGRFERPLSGCEIGSLRNLTPYLAALAEQGVEFSNARSTLTHTTKVLFSLLTGRFPSISQDIAEAVPAVKPYAGIATILKGQLNFRTAFFQSAKGNFESRPALVHNLGFDKFFAREDLNDPNAFLGYLACDEFAMLKPITEWIKADDKPFLLTILCSVTHDPYVVPDWFDTPAREPQQRYRQAILYTDKFIAALDAELARLNLTDKTIFCVIGDHGEAFGEHGLLGHERIAFEEVIHIPFCLRAPSLVKPETRVLDAVSSIDLTPTLLALLGFNTKDVGFDGCNALDAVPDDRKVYFSGWMQQSPAGFVRANRKFIYNPANRMVSVYDLSADPLESVRIELPQQQGREIADEIIAWRKNSIFRLNQQRTGKKVLFDFWLCSWTNRVSSSKYTR